MTKNNKETLRQLVLEEGVQDIIETMVDLCNDIAESSLPQRKHAYKELAGTLTWGLNHMSLWNIA